MEFKVKAATAYVMPARITVQLTRPNYDRTFGQQLGQNNIFITELSIDEANTLIDQLSKAVVEAQK